MKPVILALCLWSTAFASDYPLTAHVVGTSKHHEGGGTTSSYNATTGQWSYGVNNGATVHLIDLQIGDRLYTIERRCKVEVGQNYPARMDNKRIYLSLPDGKTCKARIDGIREAGK